METCIICKREFENKRGVGLHKWLAHKIPSKFTRCGIPRERVRICRYCKKEFKVPRKKGIRSNNRQYCSWSCSRKGNWWRMKVWRKEHPEHCRILAKNSPSASKENQKIRSEKIRREKLIILGNKCVVCGNSNPLHLQVHYKPGINGYGWRHPRHLAFIKNNKKDFEVLCANHHQEHSIVNKLEAVLEPWKNQNGNL